MKGHLGIPKNMLKRLRTIMVFVTYQHLNGNKRLTNSKPTKSGTLPNIINSGYKDECMNNQYAVLISSEIPELGELDLLRSIYRELNGYMEDYNNQINLDDLGDWKLLIQINLRNTNGGIGIFKRAKRFPSNKEFEISISIPVPNLEEARYGISDMTGIYIPLNIKNFYILSPCFSKYDNLYHYILESAKQTIDAAFTYGFTCNGKRIKKKEFITNSTTD